MNCRCVLSILLVVALGAGHPARAQEVHRVDVREDGLIGRFYTAVGASRRTGVLMLTGSGGGYPDDAAARDLARSGYPVFGIAYFRNYEGDPPELGQKQLRRVRLEYLFEALDWLKARPEVRSDRIVLMGESRGAELALMLGALRPDVAGVIAYSPLAFRWAAVGGGDAAWTLNDVPLPYVEGVYNRNTPMSQFTDILDGPADLRHAAAIEVERIRGPILLISSKGDALSPSVRMANEIETRLRMHGFSYAMENVQYEDASHLLMGFGPGQTEFRAPRFTIHFGGTAKGTEAARNAGWARAKEFLGRL